MLFSTLIVLLSLIFIINPNSNGVNAAVIITAPANLYPNLPLNTVSVTVTVSGFQASDPITFTIVGQTWTKTCASPTDNSAGCGCSNVAGTSITCSDLPAINNAGVLRVTVGDTGNVDTKEIAYVGNTYAADTNSFTFYGPNCGTASSSVTVQVKYLDGTTRTTNTAGLTAYTCTVAADSKSVTCASSGSALNLKLAGTMRVSYNAYTETNVADITPTIVASTTAKVANAVSITITGSGFGDATVGVTRSVAFSDSDFGTCTVQTLGYITNLGTQIVCAPSSTSNYPKTSGVVQGSVTVGTFTTSVVNLATITPFIATGQYGTFDFPSAFTTIDIDGYGWSAAGTVSVTLGGTGIGTPTCSSTSVSSITPGVGNSRVTCTFGTPPSNAGVLTVQITANSQSSGTATNLITYRPVIDTSTASLAADAASVSVTGRGFGSLTPSIATFGLGATCDTPPAATTGGTAWSCTWTKAGQSGALTLQLTFNGQSSTTTTIATVYPTLNVDNTVRLASITSMQVTGYGLTSVSSISLSLGAVVTTSLPATFTKGVAFTLSFTSPTQSGSLTATVTANSQTGVETQISLINPVLTTSTTTINQAMGAAGAYSSFTVNGFGFGSDVSVNMGAGFTTMSCAVSNIAANGRSFTCQLSPYVSGSGIISATISSGGRTSTSTTLVKLAPVIQADTTTVYGGNLASIIIYGWGFPAVISTVTLNTGSCSSFGAVSGSDPQQFTCNIGAASKPVNSGSFSVTAMSGADSTSLSASTQIGIIKPVVTTASTSLEITANEISISGFAFGPAASISVSLNLGASCTYKASSLNAAGTQFGCTFTTKPTEPGILTATVTSNSQSSDGPVDIYNIIPVVNQATGSLNADLSQITINGNGFGTVAGDLSVTLSLGAKCIPQAPVTDTSFVCSFTDTNGLRPVSSGTLTAVVTRNGQSAASKQIATIVPVVTQDLSTMLYSVATAGSATFTINGYGLGSTGSPTTFKSGSTTLGTTLTVQAGSYAVDGTSFTAVISGNPTTAGTLQTICVNGGQEATIRTVKRIKPNLTTTTATLAASSTQIVLGGAGWNGLASPSITVSLSNGAACTVNSAASATQATCVFTGGSNSRPISSGVMTATVTVNSIASDTLNVATVQPAITDGSATIVALYPAIASVTINGFGFGTVPPTVYQFTGSPATINAACDAGTPNAAGTQFTCSFTISPDNAGVLSAIVTSNGVDSPSQKLISIRPVVIASTADFFADTNSLVIRGYGFVDSQTTFTFRINNAASTASCPAPGAGGVTLTGGAGGEVQFTCSFSSGTRPPTSGVLEITLTVYTQTHIQNVATVRPVITADTTQQAITTTTAFTINGFGLQGLVQAGVSVQSLSPASCTLSAVTSTSFQCAISTQPGDVGNYDLIVTVNSQTSARKTVRVITPVLSASTSDFFASSNTLAISGAGFFATPVITFTSADPGVCTPQTPAVNGKSFNCDYTPNGGGRKHPVNSGALSAYVTVKGLQSNTVQLATVRPVVASTPYTVPIFPSITDITIDGWGFGPSSSVKVAALPGFSTGAFACTAGAVSELPSGDGTRFICTMTAQPKTSGALRVTVTSNSQDSNGLTQIYTVNPVIETSTTTSDANFGSFVISGYGFGSSAPSSLALSPGGASCSGTLTPSPAPAANTKQSITCTIPNNGNRPMFAGDLSAVITPNTGGGGGVSASAVVQRLRPVINSDTSSISNYPNPSSITISGYGLAPAANLIINLNLGLTCNSQTLTLGSSIGNALSYVQCSISPTVAGQIQATVTSNSIAATATNVAVHTIRPALTQVTNQYIDGSSPSMIFYGSGFGNAPAVTFLPIGTNLAACTSSPPANGQFTCTFTTQPNIGGFTQAYVTVNGVQSATRYVCLIFPTTAVSTQVIPFYPAINSLQVVGNAFGGGTPVALLSKSAVCTYIAPVSADGTSWTCKMTNQPTVSGALTIKAGVTISGVTYYDRNDYVQIANIAPVITPSTKNVAIGAPSFQITGYGFKHATQDIPAIVTLNLGASCSSDVPGGPSGGSILTCTFTTAPQSTGLLTAVVQSNGVNSVEDTVATIIPNPTVDQNTQNWAINAPTVTITGTGFGTTPALDAVSVELTPSAACTVQVAGFTDTQFVCTITQAPPAGTTVLNAVVIRAGGRSGTPVQIRTVVPTPVITPNDRGVVYNAGSPTSVTIKGSAFGTSQAELTIALSGGATCSSYTLTDTQIVCTFGNKPPVGFLTATLTRAEGVSLPAIVQWYNYAPTITQDSVTQISTGAATLTIKGANFYTHDISRNAVALNFGSGCTTTFVKADGKELRCALAGIQSSAAGSTLLASIVSNDISNSTITAVGVLSDIPAVYQSTTAYLKGVAGHSITIRGDKFALSLTENVITLQYGSATGTIPTCTITSATKTQIVCNFAAAFNPSAATPLNAKVRNVQTGYESYNFVQIATIRDRPSITQNTAKISTAATELVITGSQFSSFVLEDNVITFTPSTTKCEVTASTGTSITCKLTGVVVGTLQATIAVDGITMTTPITPVTVATVVLNPDLTARVKSVLPSSTSMQVIGVGFASPMYITLTNGTCQTVTVIDANTATCVFGGGINKPGNGEVYATSVQVDTIQRTYATPRRIGTIRDAPTITNPLVQHTGGDPFTQLVLQGTGFSTIASENNVVFSSGSCTVMTKPPPTPFELYCLTDAFTLEAGVLTAEVIVQDGVTSGPVDIYDFRPFIPKADSKVPITAQAVHIVGFYLTDNTSTIANVTLNRGNCSVQQSEITSIDCQVIDLFDSIGTLVATIDFWLNGSIYQTAPQEIGTVVPVIVDGRSTNTLPVDDLSTAVGILGQGFAPGIANNTVIITSNWDTNLQCTVKAVTTNAISCDFSIVDNELPVIAGLIAASVSSKFTAEDGFTIRQAVSFAAVIATVRPVVTTESLEVYVSIENITIEGVGFSDIYESNTVELVQGSNTIPCAVINSTFTSIFCSFAPGSLSEGALSVRVTTNGASSGTPDLIGNVIPPIDPTAPQPIEPVVPIQPPTEPQAITTDGGNGGAIAAAIVVVLIVLAVAGFFVYAFVVRKKLGATKSGMEWLRSIAGREDRGTKKPPTKPASKPSTPATKPADKKSEEMKEVKPPSKKGADDDAPPPPPEDDEDDAPPPPPEDGGEDGGKEEKVFTFDVEPTSSHRASGLDFTFDT